MHEDILRALVEEQLRERGLEDILTLLDLGRQNPDIVGAVSGYGPLDPAGVERLKLWGESISFTSSVGLNVSTRTPPAGKFWIVYMLEAKNGEAAAKNMEAFIDDGATDRGVLPGGLAAPVTADGGYSSIPAAAKYAWVGKAYIPTGWRVGIRLYNGAGSGACSWQFAALEFDQGFPSGLI